MTNTSKWQYAVLMSLAFLVGCDDTASVESTLPDSSSSAESTSSSSTIMESSSSSSATSIKAEDHPIVNYKLERNAKVNREGEGVDFIHVESVTDTAFLSATRAYDYDLDFYNVMVYYKSETGDSISEGCPAILMYTGESNSVAAAQIGKGEDFFASYAEIPMGDIAKLQSDPTLDFTALHYGMESIPKDSLMKTFGGLVIGNKFRATILTIPEGSTEQAEQPVFLVRTREGGYVKFMVTQFQGDGADKQKTLVRWQIMVAGEQ